MSQIGVFSISTWNTGQTRRPLISKTRGGMALHFSTRNKAVEMRLSLTHLMSLFLLLICGQALVTARPQNPCGPPPSGYPPRGPPPSGPPPDDRCPPPTSTTVASG
ncbi:hypothetical protein AWZ03_012682 [Drosophila navojoa]|uniref:Uncharacterized protein n=1 Tax=Drosophila navojoa TaxID=7232 RepID=A0A484AY20_DRONA|nr:uncharacterized protein LOC108656009 [Drosophila navojoa]TDG40892.1 hypothetical protein AWZ03_012682 [Drosophila navojoa]